MLNFYICYACRNWIRDAKAKRCPHCGRKLIAVPAPDGGFQPSGEFGLLALLVTPVVAYFPITQIITALKNDIPLRDADLNVDLLFISGLCLIIGLFNVLFGDW